jgi:hypothetical protein
MGKRKERLTDGNRLTVSLAPNQREALEAIAAQNAATLAFVVRYALTRFIEEHRDRQLQFQFPPLPNETHTNITSS